MKQQTETPAMPSSPDAMRAQMREAEPLLKRLDDEMENLRFDPLMPISVRAAHEKVDSVIDTLLADFRSNPILGPLIEELKSQYLEGIDEQVTAAKADSLEYLFI
ncbi:hypothetical protein ACIPL1_26415 [Pseudomonas sp. NPDC090202]|uniref:hypothetical protein n=1 Tax=unclassified Pseudomonas TaxID=196821 RepID=UPI00381155EF